MQEEYWEDQVDTARVRSLIAQSTARLRRSWRPTTRHGLRNDLACLWWLLHDRTGDLAALDQAADLLRAALGPHPWSCGPPAEERLSLMANLSGVLLDREKRTGDRADLDEGIGLARDVFDDTPPGDPRRAGRCSALGRALMYYAERFADAGALAHALSTFEDAERISSSQELPWVRSNVAECLRRLYYVEPDVTTLHRAIELARDVAQQTPPSHRLHARFQSNLALALTDLYYAESGVDRARSAPPGPSSQQAGTQLPPLLAEAITAVRSARAATPTGHPQEPERVQAHARLLMLAYQATGHQTHLTGLRTVTRMGVHVTPATHILRADALRMQADADLRHARATGDEVVATVAVTRFRDVAQDDALPLDGRIRAAESWANGALAGGDLDDVTAALAQAVVLVPRTAGRHLTAVDRERNVGRFHYLASDAAAFALASRRADLGLLLLEEGRGVLVAQALETWPEVTGLAGSHPQLVEDFRRACIATVEAERARTTEGPSGSLSGVERRRRAARQWEEAVASIRAVPGNDAFLRSPSLADLLEAGRDGPVVLVNVSRSRCDAIVVRAGRLETVPFPRLRLDDVTSAAARFTRCVHAGRDPEASLVERATAEEQAQEVLGWLWREIVGPVLDAIAPPEHDRGDLPRLWWVPTGPLTSLPLHAAGEYAVPDGPSALDRVVSSYVPTMRALLHQRRRTPAPGAGTGGRPLIVAMTRTAGADPLPGAGAEADDLVRWAWPKAHLLRDERASRRAVLEHLADSSIVHFACHAESDTDRPGDGRLLLHDAPLTVGDLGRLRLPRAELAYLSCCDTMRSSPRLADEAVHLTGAFHLAGFGHVIGTMWQTADDAAARMAKSAHAIIAEAGVPAAARAVHAAVQSERRDFPRVTSQWSALIHVGS